MGDSKNTQPPLAIAATELLGLARERMLLFDGAMGTSIQAQNLSAEAFGGLAYEGCNEHLVLTCPEAIIKIHDGFLQAGADVVEATAVASGF